MTTFSKNNQAIKRICASVSKYRLGITEIKCVANIERNSFEYHIHAQRRNSGLRGGHPRNVRYWILENLYPEQREILNALRQPTANT